MMVIRTSPLESIVLMDSFSNQTAMFFSFSGRMYFRQSSVLRANRLMLLVMTMSMFPAMHSSIMRLNSSRFFVLVPLIPSSAKIPGDVLDRDGHRIFQHLFAVM